MLELFSDLSGIVHEEFIPEGVTANKHHYKEIQFLVRVPSLWCRKTWLLLHNNVLAHRSVLVQEELAQQQLTDLPHPPYSPDLSPSHLSFFLSLKEKLHEESISVGRGDRPCRKGSQAGPSCKYLSTVFPAATLTVADLYSSQQATALREDANMCKCK
jgi:histone-lysine N-methyltransferase SETMAR